MSRCKFAVFILLFFTACEDNFTSGFYRNPTAPELSPFTDKNKIAPEDDIHNPPKERFTISQILERFSVASPADILFVIDNSGSMKTHQQDVIDNMNQFIGKFSQIPNLDWKMGLLSSDVANAPYAGFPNTGVLDVNTAGAAQIFGDAVGQLGIGGTGVEKFYDPVTQAFASYPSFNRSGAILDLVFITDTDDQSSQSAIDFKNALSQTVGGSKTIKLFGIYNQGPDFTCPATDDLVWNWATSHHLGLINAGMPTKIYKLCEPVFGDKLLELATGLVLSSAKAEIQLSARIDSSSLLIRYNGQILTAGVYYTFDEATNKIRFPNLDFASDPNLPVKIYYSYELK